jgi:hypothetical protein
VNRKNVTGTMMKHPPTPSRPSANPTPIPVNSRINIIVSSSMSFYLVPFLVSASSSGSPTAFCNAASLATSYAFANNDARLVLPIAKGASFARQYRKQRLSLRFPHLKHVYHHFPLINRAVIKSHRQPFSYKHSKSGSSGLFFIV